MLVLCLAVVLRERNGVVEGRGVCVHTRFVCRYTLCVCLLIRHFYICRYMCVSTQQLKYTGRKREERRIQQDEEERKE